MGWKPSTLWGPFKGQNPPRNFLVLLAFYALCAVSVYFFLHCKYRLEDIDDTGEISCYYNYAHQSTSADVIYGSLLPDPQTFGKIHAWIMIFLLDRFGWNKSNAYIVDTVFLLLALFLWVQILQRLGYSRGLALSFAVAALVLDPFFSAANSARRDAFVFMLDALSFCFFIEKRYFFAMLAASLAIETHPMGVSAFVYMGAYLLSAHRSFEEWRRDFLNFKTIGPALAGLVTGLLFFLALHHEAIHSIIAYLPVENVNKGNGAFNYWGEYFFRTKYYRHIPELALILLAIGIYWKDKLFKQDRFIGWSMVSLVVFVLVIPRPNFYYVLFTFPMVLLLILRVAELKKWLPWALSLFMALLMPQYLFVYHMNHDFDLEKQLREVKAAVPQDDLPIVGGSNDWFAFYQRKFFYYAYFGDFKSLGLKDFYLIDDASYRQGRDPMRDWIGTNFTGTTLATLDVNNQTIVIHRMRPLKDI